MTILCFNRWSIVPVYFLPQPFITRQSLRGSSFITFSALISTPICTAFYKCVWQTCVCRETAELVALIQTTILAVVEAEAVHMFLQLKNVSEIFILVQAQVRGIEQQNLGLYSRQTTSVVLKRSRKQLATEYWICHKWKSLRAGALMVLINCGVFMFYSTGSKGIHAHHLAADFCSFSTCTKVLSAQCKFIRTFNNWFGDNSGT